MPDNREPRTQSNDAAARTPSFEVETAREKDSGSPAIVVPGWNKVLHYLATEGSPVSRETWELHRSVNEQEYESQIAELQRQVEALSSQVGSGGRIGLQQISELQRQLDDLVKAGQQLTAPVLLPSREAMTVRLVSVGELERLEEYHVDEARSLTALGVAAGAALGMVVNAAALPKNAPRPGLLYWILFGVLFTCCALCAWWAKTAHSRAGKLRRAVDASHP